MTRSQRRWAILWVVTFIGFAAILIAGEVAAHATTTDPRFDMVGTQIAGHDVSVLCYEAGEKDDPQAFGAWGYVWTNDTETINLAADVCEGLRGIVNHDASTQKWKEALGALVLTHESFHQALRFGHSRLSEAMTECRAIRGFIGTVRWLGGSQELALELQPYALAMHYELGFRFPQYVFKSCRVPWWWK